MKTIVPITALVVAALAFAFWSSEEEVAPPKSKQPVVRQEAEKPAPPEVAQEPEPDPALREVLLGLNKKPEVVEQAQAEETEARPVRHVRRRPQRQAPEELEPLEPVATSLSDYEFQSTVGSWGGVKRCLATSSVRGAQPMSGALMVSFKIRADGAVVESRVTEVSNEDARVLAPCVEKKARRIRFPAFAGNDQITKTAKFVF